MPALPLRSAFTKRLTDRQLEFGLMLALFAAALLLCSVNLDVPLKDWDEGLVAQVARESWRSPVGSLNWLYPTLWGEPYLNKPTLIHSLITVCYAIGGVSETMARLPSAVLTAFSVPLLYAIGRELFPVRLTALWAAVIYLTSLPVVRNGRFAMLDGAILCFALLLLLCLLRSRRSQHYGLGVGIGWMLICLTKGVLVGVLFGAIGLTFLAWDTPRLLKSRRWWLGVAIGAVPVGAWYAAQFARYGSAFLSHNLLDQSLQRIWTDVENNGAPPWYYLLEILKYGAPWILFLPLGLRRIWQNRSLSWAKLPIVWGGLYLLAISLMQTKLPWYVLPLFPALALIEAVALTELWQQGKHSGLRQSQPVPYDRAWLIVFVVLAIVAGIGTLYFGVWATDRDRDLVWVLAAATLTFAVTVWLIFRQNPQFLSVLAWGMYLALFLLMLTPHWAWELAESYPVQPVADLIRSQVPDSVPLYTTYPYHRPSLNFYSDRPVLPLPSERLSQFWQRQKLPYLLIPESDRQNPALTPQIQLGSAQGWTILTKPQL